MNITEEYISNRNRTIEPASSKNINSIYTSSIQRNSTDSYAKKHGSRVIAIDNKITTALAQLIGGIAEIYAQKKID